MTTPHAGIVAAGSGSRPASLITRHAFTAYRPSAAEADQAALGTSRANRRAIAVGQARLEQRELGRLTSAEQRSAYAELPPARMDALRDLMLFS